MISEDEAESIGIRRDWPRTWRSDCEQRLAVDPRSIRATTYAKGLKDHSCHADAVPTSFAPSVNFKILDMVEGVTGSRCVGRQPQPVTD